MLRKYDVSHTILPSIQASPTCEVNAFCYMSSCSILLPLILLIVDLSVHFKHLFLMVTSCYTKCSQYMGLTVTSIIHHKKVNVNSFF